MGYAENCLPKALAALGHEVHLVTSTYNVYGTSAEYEKTYASFLGPARQSVQQALIDGYTVHRLDSRTIGRYMLIKGLVRKVRDLAPQVVHCMELASLQAFVLATARPFLGFKFFAETHQHMSVVKPYMRSAKGNILPRAAYRLTRTLPTSLSSRTMEKCYAIAPDCVHVAHRIYGVPLDKIKLQSLGTDTDVFRPAATPGEVARRQELRRSSGFAETDIVCIYSGRLSTDKNPLALAKAVHQLAAHDARFHAVFIGEGAQRDEILACRNTRVLPFVKYSELAELYRAADIAVWPRQESMSMLDAAACGLPLVVSDKMGENERVKGNGRVYKENDVEDLARVLATLSAPAERAALGAKGREKMVADFSWKSVARAITADYVAAGIPA